MLFLKRQLQCPSYLLLSSKLYVWWVLPWICSGQCWTYTGQYLWHCPPLY